MSATTAMQEVVQHATKKLEAAIKLRDVEYHTFVAQLDRAEKRIEERYKLVASKRTANDEAHGNPNASDDDLIEINAGGKSIVAKRGTLCQLKGTRLEALFSGRWEKKLQRDSNGHIFLDVNGECFQSIVDYLNDMKISPQDNPPDPPSVNEEYSEVLAHQNKLFGIAATFPMTRRLPDSEIIRNDDHAKLLHDWLDDDGEDGEFQLLYRSSRDGTSAEEFHKRCDIKGCTISVIKREDGMIVGGYSNTPLGSAPSAPSACVFGSGGFSFNGSFGPRPADQRRGFSTSRFPAQVVPSFPSSFSGSCNRADKGFVFVLSGEEDAITSKMTAKHDPKANNGVLNLSPSNAHYSPMKFAGISDMEVFQVVSKTRKPILFTTISDQTVEISIQCKSREPIIMSDTNAFSKDVNDALNSKLKALKDAEEEVTRLENSFGDEEQFVHSFASGDTKDVITLNICGTIMSTNRSTLNVFEESVLERKCDESMQRDLGNVNSCVEKWTRADVSAWAEKTDGIPDDVGPILEENEITGQELLVLGVDGLKALGIERTGTVYLLLDEINKVKRSSGDIAASVQHSPYSFGKMLDYLRLKKLHFKKLVDAPLLPTVRESERNRFERTVKYFFPGDSATHILG